MGRQKTLNFQGHSESTHLRINLNLRYAITDIKSKEKFEYVCPGLLRDGLIK